MIVIVLAHSPRVVYIIHYTFLNANDRKNQKEKKVIFCFMSIHCFYMLTFRIQMYAKLYSIFPVPIVNRQTGWLFPPSI